MNLEEQELPRTIVFIDYEHLYYGMKNQHQEAPDIQWLVRDIKKRGKLEQIYAFGDFSSPEMALERDELRLITSNIIDCSPSGQRQKDSTDFIMLDNIYKTALMLPEIEQYILVTGDGHFNSVVAHLVNFQDKKVGVYGVQDAFSQQLQRCASWVVEIKPHTTNDIIMNIVLSNLQWADKKGNIVPTFSGTVDTVSRNTEVDRQKVIKALDTLIEENFITKEITEEIGRPITKLVINWKLLKEHKIWDYENPPIIDSTNPFRKLVKCL